jgi:hypothetical protein
VDFVIVSSQLDIQKLAITYPEGLTILQPTKMSWLLRSRTTVLISSLVMAVGLVLGQSVLSAQNPASHTERPIPPTRDPHTPGYVTAKELPDGSVPPAKGYHYQFIFARNAGHVDRGVREQTLPEALEYIWQGYPISSVKH